MANVIVLTLKRRNGMFCFDIYRCVSARVSEINAILKNNHLQIISYLNLTISETDIWPKLPFVQVSERDILIPIHQTLVSLNHYFNKKVNLNFTGKIRGALTNNV